MKIEQLVEDFLFHCEYEKNLSGKTLKAYRIDLCQFKLFCSEIFVSSIDEIDKQTLKDYLKRISEGNKPKTIKRKVATLKSFFNHLDFEDIILVNPFRKVKIKIKEGKQLPRTIEISIIKRIFKHLYRIRDGIKNNGSNKYMILIRNIAIIELLFSTGIRISELCNLQEKDIDFSNGTIMILGKGNNERIVPICSTQVKSALKEYDQLNRKRKEGIEECEYFFVNRLNSRLSEQSVRFMIKKLTPEIKISQDITPHMFRHTIATLLLEGGVDIRYIQNLLGHATISTTQIYTHVNHKAQHKILNQKHPRNKILL